MKIMEVIDRIIAYHPSLPDGKPTCDGFKCGNPREECTGIVTSVQASVDAIRKTGELGANLMIVHEPTFYTHMDQTDWLANHEVYQKKLALLNRYGIAVWRDHDRIHTHRPDGIMTGIAAELGWTDYAVATEGFHYSFILPETTARDVAALMKDRIGLNAVRVIGNIDAKITNVCFVGHIIGDERAVTQKINDEGIEVAVALEALDWTTSSYIRDAGQLGMNKALLLCGHMNTEELGMKWAVHWIRSLVPDVPVTFVPSADLYQYV